MDITRRNTFIRRYCQLVRKFDRTGYRSPVERTRLLNAERELLTRYGFTEEKLHSLRGRAIEGANF